MRILVCGGRDTTLTYEEFRDYMTKELTKLEEQDLVTEWYHVTIITGGARGIDSYAARMAKDFSMDREIYVARWNVYGNAAGPIRNKQMLDQGKPDIVIAFPGGKGTSNMVTQATNAGVKVIHVLANEQQ